MKPHGPDCCNSEGEWSGSPARNDTGWDCDNCGTFIPVEPSAPIDSEA